MSKEENISTLGVRMDDSLKKDFMAVSKELGLSASMIVNALAKAVQREQRVPFDIDLNSGRAKLPSEAKTAPEPVRTEEKKPGNDGFTRLRREVIGDAKTFGLEEVNGVIRCGFTPGRFEKAEVRFVLDWENDLSLAMEVAKTRPNGKTEEIYAAVPAEDGSGAVSCFHSKNGSAMEPVSFRSFRQSVTSVLRAVEAEKAEKIIKRFKHLGGVIKLSGTGSCFGRDPESEEFDFYSGGDGRIFFALAADGKSYEFDHYVMPDLLMEHHGLKIADLPESADAFPGRAALGWRGYAAVLSYDDPSGECGGYNYSMSQSGSGDAGPETAGTGPESGGAGTESAGTSHHVFFRAFQKALDKVEAETKRRTELFDQAMSAVENLIEECIAETDNIRPVRSKGFDGGEGETVSLSCLLEDNVMIKVKTGKSPDLEYIYMDRIEYAYPGFDAENWSEDDRFYVEAAWEKETIPLMAVKRKDRETGLWDCGFFEYGTDGRGEPFSLSEELTEQQIDDFPDWSLSCRLEDISRHNAAEVLSGAEPDKISPDDFLYKTEVFTEILKSDLLDGDSSCIECADDRTLLSEMTEDIWDEVKPPGWDDAEYFDQHKDEILESLREKENREKGNRD